jgi:hypothetical protein
MEYLTLIIALWGAVLATILGIREFKKEKRSLKIILELEHWTERRKVLITNTGQRPITIFEIYLSVRPKKWEGGGDYDLRRKGSFWATEEGYKPPAFPIKLQDGEMTTFYLSETICHELYDKNNQFHIAVYDAEGHTYSKYSELEYDVKYGYRTRRYREPNFFGKIKWNIEFWLRNRKKS